VIKKTFKKLVYGLKTKLHESGKRQELLAVDHRVEMLRGGEGPPLVFLHSFLGETRWLPFHQRLADRFEVVAPAHPGFGATEGLDEIDTMEDVVFHYLDVLDGLGLKRASVVGVSLGGWIAAEIAVRYPERIDRLVLADAFGLWLDEHPIPDFVPSLADPVALRPLAFADPKGPMADLLLPAKPSDEVRATIARSAAATARLGARSGMHGMHDPKLARRLRRVTCPTLVVWGDRDPLLPLAYAEAWRDQLPKAELQVLENCGHLPHFEQEARFVEAVTEFCARK
jgi:pimeloyl-ACP methyl ester carboxylesterase